MSAHGEGHGPGEAGPPGGLVEVLARWEDSGGRWKVLDARDDWIEIGLFTCDGGEEMSRVGGARTTVLHSYLAGRTTSVDQRQAELADPDGPQPRAAAVLEELEHIRAVRQRLER